MKIGIIVAMDRELLQLQRLFGAEEVRVEKCGIGKVNAALGTQRMIDSFRPDVIISSGCAGGCGKDVRVQDVVVSTALCYHDVYCGRALDGSSCLGQVQGFPPRFDADPMLVEKARGLQLGDASFKLHTGLIVTGDWFVDSREKMQSIFDSFPDALAVDMESAAIAHTCYINNVPFISFRVVSDTPLCDTRAAMYHDFWATLADHSFGVTRDFVNSLL